MKHKPGADNPSLSAHRPASKQSFEHDSRGWRALWLRCLEAACTEWKAIPYNDLAISGGDRRKLTRLVEMHYDLADGEARRQVDAFLRECQSRN